VSYTIGFENGRKQGQEESQKVRGVYSSATDVPDITLTVTPVPNANQGTPIPSTESTITLNICQTLPVITQEVLVRADAGLTAPVIAAVPRDTKMNVICYSERMIQNVAWLNVAVHRPNAETIVGWIPAQDIDYPSVCLNGRVKPANLPLRDSFTLDSTVVGTLPQGAMVGIVCNSVWGYPGTAYWVRVKAVVNGEIILGWAYADDVL
jgi:hypothetical protein